MDKTAQMTAVPEKDLAAVVYVTTDSERKQFLNFPYQHYKYDENWVAPLKIQQKELIDTKKNPFYRNAEIALFLAYHNDRLAGRIAAIVNHTFNRHNKEKAGFFGFYECIENQFVTDLLLRVVRDWLSQKGCERLLGPMSPGLLDEIGIQISGFEHRPAILMPHSKPYYDTLLQGAGLKKEMDLLAYKVTTDTVAMNRMERAREIVKKRNPGLTIRSVRKKNFKTEVEIVRTIFNQAWARNWGFYEMDKEMFTHLAKTLRIIIDPDMAVIAEIDGKPVGFSIALPDYNQVFRHMNGTLFPTGIFKLFWYRRKMDNARTALMGVLPEYRNRGIDALMIQTSAMKGMKNGYRSSELGWLLETNTDIIRVSEKVGGHLEKKYRMYSQPLR